MDNKEHASRILKRLRERKISRLQIEQELDYRPGYIDQQMSRGVVSAKLLNGLKRVEKQIFGISQTDPEEAKENLGLSKEKQESEILPVLVELMKRQNNMLENQNRILDQQYRLMDDKIGGIEVSLKNQALQVDGLSLQVRVRGNVVLQSLERLERLPAGSLVMEADNTASAAVAGGSKKGRRH